MKSKTLLTTHSEWISVILVSVVASALDISHIIKCVCCVKCRQRAATSLDCANINRTHYTKWLCTGAAGHCTRLDITNSCACDSGYRWLVHTHQARGQEKKRRRQHTSLLHFVCRQMTSRQATNVNEFSSSSLWRL